MVRHILGHYTTIGTGGGGGGGEGKGRGREGEGRVGEMSISILPILEPVFS